MRHLLPILCEYLESGEPIALVTLVSSKGSSPRSQGASLIANKKGLISGTIGGGAAEASAIEESKKLLVNGGSKLLTMKFTNTSPTIAGMVCGGNVEILLQVIAPEQIHFYRKVQETIQKEKGLFITPIETEESSKPNAFFYHANELICSSQEEKDTSLFNIAQTLHPQQEATCFVHEGKKYFVKPLLPPCTMIIIGGGHVAVPTAELASIADFAVHVIDDRVEFSTQKRFPKALSVTTLPEFTDCFAPFTPQKNTYIIIVTRGHTCDGTVLAQALRSDAGYIGMIGSKKKRQVVYDFMLESGFSNEDLQRVHCPIGLEIGAETPTEIAFSIVGECIAHRNKKASY